MSLKKTEKIWRDGKLINWDDANIHVLSHVVSYGSSVFEGIRCYETKKGPGIFRLPEHVRRMYDSSKIYRMEITKFEQHTQWGLCGREYAAEKLTDRERKAAS